MDGYPETGLFPFLIPLLIPVIAIIGGFVIALLAIYGGIRKREFQHRERLAMIEKGLAPDQTPGGPAAAVRDAVEAGAREAFLADHGQMWRPDAFAADSARAAQIRRGGFILDAVGLGIFLMIYLTSGELRPALGIGAFLVVLGTAIFLSSYFGGVGRGQEPSKQPRGPESRS